MISRNLLLASLTYASMVFFCNAGEAKTRISITKFTDKHASSTCSALDWFNYESLGSGMQDQLISELSKNAKYAIQERETIQQIYYDEHELINSKKSNRPKKNKFKSAEYTVVAAITSFEYCNKGNERKLNLGRLLGTVTQGAVPDFEVGSAKQNAKVGIDFRIIKVETGEVVKAFSTEGLAERPEFKISGDVAGVGFGSEDFARSPLGEASRDAIKKAVDVVAATI